MENNIFNSFYTESFLSPCIYELIICIHIFSCIEAALQKKKNRFSAGLEPAAVFRCNACTLELVILAIPAEVCNVAFLWS